jgi:hypothetical protein
MTPVLLAEDIGFWDVIWWLLIVFFWTMVLWMFISIFGDIFRRSDLSGWGKAAWLFLIVVLPFIGILIYMIARPAVTPSDIQMMEQAKRASGATAASEITKAQELLKAGAITQAEFDQIKSRALS